MALLPSIDYKHVLSELSVNREIPCEVIRELISNSYDAAAKNIAYAPLSQYEGFLFYDDGIGLSREAKVNGISPYEAFFSIGKSTKVMGDQIGYKCQGSKLCFACNRFAIITRDKEDQEWHFFSIENPKVNLSLHSEITPKATSTPWDDLFTFFSSPDERTTRILNQFNQGFFEEKFKKSGVLVVILHFECEEYIKYFNELNPSEYEKSYLYNYVRFFTKHGDVNFLDENQGFSRKNVLEFSKIKSKKNDIHFRIWCGIEWKSIPQGYPYLEVESEKSSSPKIVSDLRYGRFSSRHASVVEFNQRKYSLIFAIDGNKRALEGYSNLGRKGSNKSGIRLTDQRGTFIASHGIKSCSYNDLFNHPLLSDFSVLQDLKAQLHYIFIIDGSFSLVTNRNEITEETLATLKSSEFVEKIKSFLENSKRAEVFNELILRLNRDASDIDLDKAIKSVNELKSSVQKRERFRVKSIDYLADKWFLSPTSGEEHWVGSLYAIFSNFVKLQNPYFEFWNRPITYSARGIDSLGQNLNERTLSKSTLKSIEYKFIFSNKDTFNHPLHLTDVIICWEVDISDLAKPVTDSYERFGGLTRKNHEGLDYFEISNVQSKLGDIYDNHQIIVLSLKTLLNLSFDISFTSPT
jgi:hypothetical protein